MIRILLIALSIILIAPQARAAEFDYDAFSALPIQHGGRIKPIDSFARGILESFAGRDSVAGMNADAWLAQVLFDPAYAIETPTFRLLKPEIIGLPARKGRLYAYQEIAPALQARVATLQKLAATDPKDWSEDQKELAHIQDLSLLYGQLLRSFSFVLPLNIDVPDKLAKAWKIDPSKPLSLQDLRPHTQKLEKSMQAIIRRKGDDPAKYNQEEKQTALLAFSLATLEGGAENNIVFRILPATTSGNDAWFSPWESMDRGEGSPRNAAYLDVWKDMALAYSQGDKIAWNASTGEAKSIAAQFEGTHKIPLELIYNTLHPLTAAMIFYLLAFFAFVAYALRDHVCLRTGAVALLSGGLVLHGTAIILRVLILSRPPVGTLYESILFVAFVCVLAALAYEFFKKDGNGVMMGAASGLLLLFCAGSFSGEDSMGVLVAVLNTNFWLGTHVVCITMGYAFCLLTAMTAHLWLIARSRGQNADGFLVPVKILSLVSLLLTAVGTILGGIWADQSWGRFWGWDPKENGALLIVLWLIWLIHGQLAGQISRAFYMAGMAALTIIVALAWFGVNLLATGLHSYGFISGVAAGLFTFCAAQIALLGFLWHRGRHTA